MIQLTDDSIVLLEEIEPPDRLPPTPDRPHLAVLVSLNFPDMTPSLAALHRRFTGNVLRAITNLGASYTLLDTTHADELTSAPMPVADALLVLGGGDIHPRLASDNPAAAPNTYGVDEAADRVSIEVIKAHADRPTLGICRGSQLINVAWGGTIIADLPGYAPHHGPPDGELFVDEVIDVVAGTRLASLVGAGGLRVRSGHHQAVDAVSGQLRAAAFATDGIVEAVEHPTRWIVGVQFHPEDDDGSDRELALLLGGLVNAATDR